MKFSILITLIIFFAIPAEAARIYFALPVLEMGAGGEYKVDLMLDTEGEEVNAIELELRYPEDLLNVEHVLTSQSIVGLWIERPQAENGAITFAGIMPLGSSGVINPETDDVEAGELLSLVLSARAGGSGTIALAEGKVIKNDGQATSAEINFEDLLINVSSARASSSPYILSDVIPPAPFLPVVIRSELIADDDYVLTFHTVDAGSGIDHYEVSEGTGEFKRAESPHLLADQGLSSIIRVRAIDAAGNERTEVIYPAKSMSVNLFAVALAIIFILLFLWIFKKLNSLRR